MKFKYALPLTVLFALFVFTANSFAKGPFFQLEYSNIQTTEWTTCDTEGATFQADFNFLFTDAAHYEQTISIDSYGAYGYLGTNTLQTSGWMPSGALSETGHGYTVPFGLFGVEVPHLHGFPGWIAQTYVVTDTYMFHINREEVLTYQVIVTCDLMTNQTINAQFNLLYAPFWP